MPVGPIFLLILLVLIATGYGAKSLSLLRLRPAPAFVLCLAALVGAAFQYPVAPGLTLNVGAAAVPLLLSLFVAVTARPADVAWGCIAAGVTAALLYQIGRIFPVNSPSELNFIYLDVQYLLAAAGAVAGCVTARTARGAFAAATFGVTLADLAHYVAIRAAGSLPEMALYAGGSSGAATAAVAAVLAVVLFGFVKQPAMFPRVPAGRTAVLVAPEPVRQSDRLT